MRPLNAVLATVLTIAAGLLVASPAQADHVDNSSGYHWPGAYGQYYDIEFVDSTPDDWGPRIAIALDEWTGYYIRPKVLSAHTVRGKHDWRTRRDCDIPGGRVRVCGWSYGRTGWVGQTITRLDDRTKHITGASVKFNGSYTNAEYDDETAKQRVVCHEFGHVFGLTHRSDGISCMNEGDVDHAKDPLYLHPDFHDYQTLYRNAPMHPDAKSGTATSTIRTGRTVTHVSWAQ